jgi:site-specific recombinase XerD
METEKDINSLLETIALGRHTISDAIDRFLSSLPGYNYKYHTSLTIRTYERCLLRDPLNFRDFIRKEGIEHIELLSKDKLILYKEMVMNKVEARTACKYVTAVRQMVRYIHRLGWINEDLCIDYRLPRPKPKGEIDVIRPEVCELLVKGNWGYNEFTRKRNQLVLYLFLRRGMHPMEVPKILLEHIEPYRDLGIIHVCGKRGRWREVMLDPASWATLQQYAPVRAEYLRWRGVHDEHLIIGSNPRSDGSYAMTTAGVSGIIKRIVELLRNQGCLFSLKNVTPNIMRHTAESADWERVEHLPVKNPELSVCGQYGNSPAVAIKHYVRHSRRNAYILIKGGSIVDDTRQGMTGAHSDMQEFRNRFPESSLFVNPGDGI